MDVTESTGNSGSVVTAKAAAKTHLGYIDGFRAVAALSVMFLHLTQIAFPIDSRGPFMVLTQYLLYWINPVPTFIVISGFCLMLPVVNNGGVLKGGARTFFFKRARRILPPYYIALAFCALLILTVLGHKTGNGWDSALPLTKRSLITHLLLVQQLSGLSIYRFDPPMWSIGVEWWIYFLFPLLLLGWKTVGVVKTTLATALVTTLIWWPVRNGHYAGMSPMLCLLFDFGMVGATIAFSNDAKFVSLRQSSACGILSAVLILPNIFFWTIGYGQQWSYYPSTLCTGVWAACVLIYASNRDVFAHKILSGKSISKIGLFSYTLYLTHYPIGQLFYYYVARTAHLSPLLTELSMWTIGAACAVAFAALVYPFVEQPFLNSKVIVETA